MLSLTLLLPGSKKTHGLQFIVPCAFTLFFAVRFAMNSYEFFIYYISLSTVCKFIIATIWFCISSTVSILILPIFFLVISKSISENNLSQKQFVSGDAPIKAVTSELVSNCPNTSFSSFSEIVEICSKSVIRCGCIFGSNMSFIVMSYNLEISSKVSKSGTAAPVSLS